MDRAELARRGEPEVIEMRCQGCGRMHEALTGPFCGPCAKALRDVLTEVATELKNTPVEQRVVR